jgi:hypothetical protein
MMYPSLAIFTTLLLGMVASEASNVSDGKEWRFFLLKVDPD